jgi:hypothetical protein
MGYSPTSLLAPAQSAKFLAPTLSLTNPRAYDMKRYDKA